MRELECVVCGAELVPSGDPPHCVDCYVSEEDRARWEDVMSEARSGHEWEEQGHPYRVVWRDGYWTIFTDSDVSSERGGWIRLLSREAFAVAAEIARLRGLVPPGGEEEKG